MLNKNDRHDCNDESATNNNKSHSASSNSDNNNDDSCDENNNDRNNSFNKINDNCSSITIDNNRCATMPMKIITVINRWWK